ncbi:MAG: 30S ribosomal protein S20 [Deltaproteobacteria bacterium]|nr:30S ribosomal protein S20 [Deltaproteobacteria bacterium]
MAHHRSAIKRHLQSIKRRDRNRFFVSTMRTHIKRTRDALVSDNREEASTVLRTATAFIQMVAGKGIIHRNKASRLVSRLTSQFYKKFEA